MKPWSHAEFVSSSAIDLSSFYKQLGAIVKLVKWIRLERIWISKMQGLPDQVQDSALSCTSKWNILQCWIGSRFDAGWLKHNWFNLEEKFAWMHSAHHYCALVSCSKRTCGLNQCFSTLCRVKVMMLWTDWLGKMALHQGELVGISVMVVSSWSPSSSCSHWPLNSVPSCLCPQLLVFFFVVSFLALSLH